MGIRVWLSSIRWSLTGICACLSLVLAHATVAQEKSAAETSTPKPVARVDLSNTGYQPGSRMARLAYEGSQTLSFVDADHVLLTFNPKKMFQRLPECPHWHDDWLVHAVILEVPSGKTLANADWYLHDRRRYLWPLGDGKFLLRRLNSLYVVDSTLREKLLLTSPKELAWVSVTPDRKQVIVETAENDDPSSAKDTKDSKTQYQVQFLNLDTLTSQRTFGVSRKVALEGTSKGYADSVHHRDLWLIRFGPTAAERHNIALVRSRRMPQVFYASDNSLVIGRCAKAACDYAATSFTIAGRRLWRQHWDQARYFPAVTRSEDSIRFGVSSLKLAELSNLAANRHLEASTAEGTGAEGLEQSVQVFEAASGAPVLKVDVSPAVISGQNVALSPDGLRFAVLYDSAIELFDLPKIRDEERAQFTALKADVPGLYVVSAKQGAESGLDSGTDTEHETTDGAGSAPADTGRATDASQNVASSSTPAATDASKSTNESDESLTTLKVVTRAVVVDVVVTDRDGHPVKGLPQQDFEAQEDGKKQDLRYFHEFRSERDAPAIDKPTPSAAAKPLANVFTNATNAPDPGAVTLVLLDLLNTPLASQAVAWQQLIKFLRTKEKGARFALCVLNPGRNASLHLIQGFTSDENTLLAAINSKDAKPREARWEAAQTEASVALRSTVELARNDNSRGNNDWQGVLSSMQEMQAQVRAANTDERVGITIDVLTYLSRYLAGVPGRKNLVWLSGSFPMAISPGSASDLRITENRIYMDKVKQATNMLAKGQIAVYPVDVRGLESGGDSAVDNNFRGLGEIPKSQTQAKTVAGAGSAGNNRDYTPTLDDILQQQKDEQASGPDERSTMNQFAKDTGGKAFYNTNAIEAAIATATEQGSNYYSLSYTPTNGNYNGKFRKIKVALVQKGYQLHYRQGYYAEESGGRNPGEMASGIGEAAMQHGSPLAHQIRFAVRVVPIGAKTKIEVKQSPRNKKSKKELDSTISVEVQRYGVDYAIDNSDLRFLANNSARHLSLGVEVASFADDGRRLTNMTGMWTNDFKPSAYKDVIAGGLRIHQEVDVPTQAASLRLGVEDLADNRLGTIELPMPVPAPPDVPRIKRHLPEIEPD